MVFKPNPRSLFRCYTPLKTALGEMISRSGYSARSAALAFAEAAATHKFPTAFSPLASGGAGSALPMRFSSGALGIPAEAWRALFDRLKSESSEAIDLWLEMCREIDPALCSHEVKHSVLWVDADRFEGFLKGMWPTAEEKRAATDQIHRMIAAATTADLPAAEANSGAKLPTRKPRRIDEATQAARAQKYRAIVAFMESHFGQSGVPADGGWTAIAVRTRNKRTGCPQAANLSIETLTEVAKGTYAPMKKLQIAAPRIPRPA